MPIDDTALEEIETVNLVASLFSGDQDLLFLGGGNTATIAIIDDG